MVGSAVMPLRATMKSLFFDSPAVIRAMDKTTRKVLSKFGAYTRRTSRTSIRPATPKRDIAPSTPGSPPRNRTGPLRANIFFAATPDKKGVIIGPAKFGRSRMNLLALEAGGTISTMANPRRTIRKPGDGGEIALDRWTGQGKPLKDAHGAIRLVSYARLVTSAQAARANRIQEDLYGPMMLPPRQIAARPFMRPAFEKNLLKLPGLWAGAQGK